MNLLVSVRNFCLIVFSAVFLTACTIQLVPSYDKELVSGLDTANEKALTLFSALGGGSTKSEYSTYKDDYSETVGKLKAMQQRAETRQIPPLAKRLKKIKFVSQLCDAEDDASACVNASPRQIGSAIDVLETMQRTHKDNGLSDDLVTGFETGFTTAIQQALFVERALER
ncbi:MAG: hypothetical protein QNJ15_09105 [Erythrobacter sp.]|nr:hypothetical protein [Erythrobacter sp.]